MEIKTKNRIYLFAILVPVCLVVAMFFSLRKDTGDLFIAQTVKWAALPYQPIETNSVFLEKLNAIKLTQKEGLSERQRSLLLQGIYRSLIAYYGDTYNGYMAFRAPIDKYTYNSEAIEIQKQYCETDWKNPTKNVPDDPEGIHKRFWEVRFLNLHIDKTTEIKNSTLGEHLFKGINFENSSTVVESLNAAPRRLNELIMEKYRIGAFTPISSIEFENTPATILKATKKLILATVTLQLQLPKPEPACPFIVRFYWDAVNTVWLPLDIGMGVPGFTRTRELVF